VVWSLSAKTFVTSKCEGGLSLIDSPDEPIGYLATNDLAPTQ
jgi:hypothetical protein